MFVEVLWSDLQQINVSGKCVRFCEWWQRVFDVLLVFWMNDQEF